MGVDLPPRARYRLVTADPEATLVESAFVTSPIRAITVAARQFAADLIIAPGPSTSAWVRSAAELDPRQLTEDD